MRWQLINHDKVEVQFRGLIIVISQGIPVLAAYEGFLFI